MRPVPAMSTETRTGLAAGSGSTVLGAGPTPAEVRAAGPQPIYWTADDVAGTVQVSRSTVFRWAKSDPTMPVLAIGGVLRFPRERLLVWLRTRERGSIARPRPANGHLNGHLPGADGAARP